MLVQGWILLAGTFYLSPFLCEFLAVPGCLLFVAVCIYLWFPHPQKNVTSLSFLSFHHLCSSLSLHFFPWPRSLSFRLLQLCPGTVLLEMPEACIFPLQSDSDVTHLLNALFVCSPGLCWPWLVRSECCLFAEETLVSLNSVTAPCCYSKINRRILIGFIPFLRASYHFFRFCSLKKLKKKQVKIDWLDFTPELPQKHAVASYCGADFSPSLCIRLEVAALWEMIQKQKSQPCPRVGRWMAGCGNDWLIFIHALQNPGVREVLFSYLPSARQDHSASGDFQAANHWFRGFRFPKASLGLETKISAAALCSSITENPLCAPAQYWHLEPGSWEGWAPVACREVVTLWEGVWCWDPPQWV